MPDWACRSCPSRTCNGTLPLRRSFLLGSWYRLQQWPAVISIHKITINSLLSRRRRRRERQSSNEYWPYIRCLECLRIWPWKPCPLTIESRDHLSNSACYFRLRIASPSSTRASTSWPNRRRLARWVRHRSGLSSSRRTTNSGRSVRVCWPTQDVLGRRRPTVVERLYK